MTRDGVPPAAPAGGGAGDGPRRCSQCGNHGHNTRTCTVRPPVKLFGVRIGDKPIRKSLSMGNLAQLAEGSGGARAEGYGSEGDDADKPHRKRGEISVLLSLSPVSPTSRSDFFVICCLSSLSACHVSQIIVLDGPGSKQMI